MAYRLTHRSSSDGDPVKVKQRPSTRRRRLQRRTVAGLPTWFTLGNLLCGFLAIFFASRPYDVELPWQWTPLTMAATFIFLGMFFDTLDGRVARLTGQTSELGEQLDSMADMVAFGTAPAFISIELVGQLIGVGTPFFGSEKADTFFGRAVLVISGIYVACAALRLARFNIEAHRDPSGDHLSFRGMPSPAAAGTVASFVLLHQHFLAKREGDHWTVSTAAVAMVAIMLLVAVAMVSRLRYPHVANRYLRGKARFNTIKKIVIIAPLLVIWPQMSLAAAFAIYALSAPAIWTWKRLAAKPPPIIHPTTSKTAPDESEEALG